MINKKIQEKELSTLTDQELLAEAKKMKSAALLNATLIGIMIGVVIYSVAKNSVGFFTLVPLFFIYKIVNNPENNEKNATLNKLLKERNLK